MEKTNLARKTFSYFVRMVYAAGVPLLEPNTSRIYYLNTFLTIVLCYGTFVGIVVHTILYHDDLGQVTLNALLITGCINIFTMHIYMRSQSKKLNELLELTSEFTWESLPSQELVTSNMTMAGMVPWIKKRLCWNYFAILFLLLVYCIARFAAVNNRPLVITVAQPLDLSSDFNYWMVNGLQFYGLILFISLFHGYMGLFSMLVVIACSQLEKLSKRLQDIKWSSEGNEAHLHFQISSCIKFHQKIMRYLRQMEHLMNPVILVHFLILTFGICFCVFAGVMLYSLNRQDFMVQIGMFYNNYLLQLFIYCWFGSQLTKQAENVKQAVWNMNWVGTPIKFQRKLLFITTFTNYEFHLTAGKIAVVSLSTMLQILNQSYGYLMFLINFRNDDHHSIEEHRNLRNSTI